MATKLLVSVRDTTNCDDFQLGLCRNRKEAINLHYRERMARVTAYADSSRHAESKGIPAVCTALAGELLFPFVSKGNPPFKP